MLTFKCRLIHAWDKAQAEIRLYANWDTENQRLLYWGSGLIPFVEHPELVTLLKDEDEIWISLDQAIKIGVNAYVDLGTDSSFFDY